MQSQIFSSDSDLQAMRGLITALGSGSAVVDFEEMMQMESVRAVTRLWWSGKKLIAFAYVDDCNNLWFEVLPEFASAALGHEIVSWGTEVMQSRNQASDSHDTLDASCHSDDTLHLYILLQEGFTQFELLSLKYERSLLETVEEYPIPEGFRIRPARMTEIDDLVALHRAVFGTDQMTVERRLAIMQAPGYLPDLDLLAIAPNGKPVAFCICGVEEENKGEKIGFTDPVGVHSAYRRLGLARVLISRGLLNLQKLGAVQAQIGTSSENRPMQRLAESLGFQLAEQKRWFSKTI